MKRDITFNTTIEINDIEINVDVTGTFYLGSRGVRHGFDRFAEPDEPDEFSISKIVCPETGIEYFENEMTAAEWERLETEGIENANDDEFDFIDEY